MPTPPPTTPSAELRQRLRLRRFLLASSFSLLYLVVLAIFHAEGGTDRETLLTATGIVVFFIAAYLLAFLTGINRRARDPSLTSLQMVTAMATMLFVFYRAPETRVVFGAFFFVALTFGLLRSGGLRLGLVGGFTLLAYAATSLARWLQGGGEEVLRMDILQFVSLLVALPWFVFIATLARKLRDADHRKDAVLATVVHELRTPLSPILNGVRALRAWSGEASAHKVLPMMERQLGHMTRLLDDLFDIAGIVQGKIDLRLKRIDLRTVIHEAVEVAGPLVQERRHELIVSTPATPMMIDADHLRLTQVVTNLLSNAAKYTPPRGRIELEVRPRDAAVEVTIRDNGVGIPRHRLRSIFEMYNQVGTGSSDRQPGLGIGLALVLQLVRLHGGTIEARSGGEGRGSEFCVWLPLDPRAQQSPSRASTDCA